jgi:hypothetical protein
VKFSTARESMPDARDGAADVSDFGDGHEIAQLPEFHSTEHKGKSA